MKRISVYLDDFRIPIEPPSDKTDWVIVKNYDEFVELIENEGLDNIEIISLDHDLDKSASDHYFYHVKFAYSIDYSKIKEKTGFDAAKWLVEKSRSTGIDLPRCYVHSANPIGSGNIMGYINQYLKEKRLPENCIRTKWEFKNKH